MTNQQLHPPATSACTHPIRALLFFSSHAVLQPQVENMTNKWAVYMTMDGRISMAGLSGALCCAQCAACVPCCAVLMS